VCAAPAQVRTSTIQITGLNRHALNASGLTHGFLSLLDYLLQFDHLQVAEIEVAEFDRAVASSEHTRDDLTDVGASRLDPRPQRLISSPSSIGRTNLWITISSRHNVHIHIEPGIAQRGALTGKGADQAPARLKSKPASHLPPGLPLPRIQ
jgi:hypothetical protein